MDEVALADVIEMFGGLKAQQHADAAVIQCLLAAFVSGTPLQDAWARRVSQSVVEEQLYAQTNATAAAALNDFKDRLGYWDGIIKSLAEDHG
jgi:hypothetical protein